MLGAAYHLGAGVKRDPIAAFTWLLRGQKGGSQLAGPFIAAARKFLKPSEIAEADRQSDQPLPEAVE
jgi:TPR repeat protein